MSQSSELFDMECMGMRKRPPRHTLSCMIASGRGYLEANWFVQTALAFEVARYYKYYIQIICNISTNRYMDIMTLCTAPYHRGRYRKWLIPYALFQILGIVYND